MADIYKERKRKEIFIYESNIAAAIVWLIKQILNILKKFA
jgi:hypothetical protein